MKNVKQKSLSLFLASLMLLSSFAMLGASQEVIPTSDECCCENFVPRPGCCCDHDDFVPRPGGEGEDGFYIYCPETGEAEFIYNYGTSFPADDDGSVDEMLEGIEDDRSTNSVIQLPRPTANANITLRAEDNAFRITTSGTNAQRLIVRVRRPAANGGGNVFQETIPHSTGTGTISFDEWIVVPVGEPLPREFRVEILTLNASGTILASIVRTVTLTAPPNQGFTVSPDGQFHSVRQGGSITFNSNTPADWFMWDNGGFASSEGTHGTSRTVNVPSNAVVGSRARLLVFPPCGNYTWRYVTVTAALSLPNAPTTLAPSPIGHNSATLRWNAPTVGAPFTRYYVEWRRGTTGAVQSNNTTATTLAISGLTANTTYQFRVRARNAQGQGTWSAWRSFTTNAAPITNINLHPSVPQNIRVGDTLSFIATTTPIGLQDELTWTSSNPNVAAVSASGIVTARATGSTTITAMSSNGRTATMTITVAAASSFIITPSDTYHIIPRGGSITFTAPSSVEWSDWDNGTFFSGRSFTVNVSLDAFVGHRMRFTAFNPSTGNLYTRVVIVERLTTIPPIVDIRITEEAWPIIGNNFNVTTRTTPSGQEGQLIWTSSNNSIATVNSGVITPVRTGTATITATAPSGVRATMIVNVRPYVPPTITNISLSPSIWNARVGDDPRQITATTTPFGQQHRLNWSSSNPSIVSIDANGIATVLRDGTATITAYSGTTRSTMTINVGATSTVSNWTQLQTAVNNAPVNATTTIILTESFRAEGNAITIRNNQRISIVSSTAAIRTITQSRNAQRHFIVYGTLTLENRIILSGGDVQNTNNSGGVWVRDGGHFTMNLGSVIENCHWRSDNGGAVRLRASGTSAAERATFTLNGGIIRNNSAATGGGVSISTNGRMYMLDGTISGNTATNNDGGGIRVTSGATALGMGFNMTGGTISWNTAMRNGGGIFSNNNSLSLELPPFSYSNLRINNATFLENVATTGASAPPTNTVVHVSNIRQTSAWGTLFNNFDINYIGRLGHTPLIAGRYFIKNLQSDLFMSTSGTSIVQRNFARNNHQMWELLYDSGGFFRIRDVNSGRFVTSPESSASGAAITLENALSGNARSRQRWLFTLQSDLTYTIRAENRATFVLSINSNSSSEGIEITQRSPNDGSRTRWDIVISSALRDNSAHPSYGIATRTFALRQVGTVTSQGIWQVAINDGVAAWNNSGAGTNISTRTGGNSPHTITAESRAGVSWWGQVAGNPTAQGILNSSSITLNTRTIPNTSEQRQFTVVHEIGHLLWLRDNPHSISNLSVMNYTSNTRIAYPRAFDIRNVRFKYD